MKLGNPARLRVAAALCAGGLMATVPVTPAAAIPSLPDPDCDPRPRRILTIVEGMGGFLSGDGQDCTVIDQRPPPPDRDSDDAGADGGNARVTGSENGAEHAVIPEEPVADAPPAEAPVADAPSADAPVGESAGG